MYKTDKVAPLNLPLPFIWGWKIHVNLKRILSLFKQKIIEGEKKDKLDSLSYNPQIFTYLKDSHSHYLSSGFI